MACCLTWTTMSLRKRPTGLARATASWCWTATAAASQRSGRLTGGGADLFNDTWVYGDLKGLGVLNVIDGNANGSSYSGGNLNTQDPVFSPKPVSPSCWTSTTSVSSALLRVCLHGRNRRGQASNTKQVQTSNAFEIRLVPRHELQAMDPCGRGNDCIGQLEAKSFANADRLFNHGVIHRQFRKEPD